MKKLFKKIVVIEMEILVSDVEKVINGEYKNSQTTMRVLNEYDADYYKELFDMLRIVQKTFHDIDNIKHVWEDERNGDNK